MADIPDPVTTEWVPIWNPTSVGPVGPQGPQGVKGDQGIQGNTGPIGPQGIQGVKGDKGDQGVQGTQGVQGVKGDTGAKGDKGDTGNTGATGPQGVQGVQGETGPEGPKGDTGDNTQPHHVQHEPGGNDQITRLTLSGTSPQIRLHPAVGIPITYWIEPAAPVDAKAWRVYLNEQKLVIDTLNDAENAVLSTAFRLTRDGSLTIGGRELKIAGGNPYLSFYDSSGPVDGRQLLLNYNAASQGLHFMAFNDAISVVKYKPLVVGMRADGNPLGGIGTGNVAAELTGRIVVNSSNSYYGLEIVAPTVTGGFHAGLIFNEPSRPADARKWRINCYQGEMKIERLNDAENGVPAVTPLRLPPDSSVHCGAALYTAGAVYFGDTVAETGFTLQGHATYGLYCNTGLYLAYQLVIAAPYGISCGGVVTASGGLTVTAGGASITGTLVVNAVQVNVGGLSVAQELTVGTSIVAGGNIHNRNGAYLYPGRIDTGADGNIQSTWLLASHGSYGLYSNTGIYFVGGVEAAVVTCRGHMTFGSNDWFTTYSDGWQRLHFTHGGSTWVKGSTINFRTTSNGVDDFDVGTFGAGGHFTTNFGVRSGYGYLGKAGLSGAFGGNWWNYNWVGSGLNCWIDNGMMGDVFIASDARLKRDFTPLKNSLDKVLQMRPGTFYFKQTQEGVEPDPRLHLGLKAQDMLDIAPEVVFRTGMKTPLTPDGLLRVDYTEMVPMLVAAIQELEQRVTRMEK